MMILLLCNVLYCAIVILFYVDYKQTEVLVTQQKFKGSKPRILLLLRPNQPLANLQVSWNLYMQERLVYHLVGTYRVRAKYTLICRWQISIKSVLHTMFKWLRLGCNKMPNNSDVVMKMSTSIAPTWHSCIVAPKSLSGQPTLVNSTVRNWQCRTLYTIGKKGYRNVSQPFWEYFGHFD